ncbi:MAG: zinc ribbon domain-containing protein, partial [Burkholderiales bacterium]|nr:zinc ribbon domain-containing protein [Burkholderiales bacterium]
GGAPWRSGSPPPAPVASVPKPPAPPPPPASPSQACSGRSFLSLAICINDQCGTPQFTSHPQCVRLREDARRIEEERRLGGN